MRENASVELSYFLIHVSSVHDSYKYEDKCHNAESSKEIELALDEANHCNAASLIETAIVMSLLIYLHSNIRFPDT